MRHYKKFQIWIKSKDIAKQVYIITSNFPSNEKYGLTSQMRRSAISIPANIAEGAGRSTTKDFLNFLNIAMGSTNELSTHLIIAYEIGLIPEADFRMIDEEIEEFKSMLYKFHLTTKKNN